MKTEYKYSLAVLLIAIVHCGIGLAGLSLQEYPECGVQYWVRVWGLPLTFPYCWFEFDLMPDWFGTFVIIPLNSLLFATLVCTPIYFLRKKLKHQERITEQSTGGYCR